MLLRVVARVALCLAFLGTYGFVAGAGYQVSPWQLFLRAGLLGPFVATDTMHGVEKLLSFVVIAALFGPPFFVVFWLKRGG